MKKLDKNKAFTLVELLAVIVILGIIALIITPIVTDAVKEAKLKSAKVSASGYVKAVGTMIATEELKGNIIEDGVYTISNGDLTLKDKTYDVKFSGDAPDGGIVVIENGGVSSSGTRIEVGDYTVTYASDGELITNETSSSPICTLLSGNSGEVSSKYTCDTGDGEKTFYILENLEDSPYVSLIMDSNIGSPVAWCLSGTSNTCNADGAIAALKKETAEWKNYKILSIDLPTYGQLSDFNFTNGVGPVWLFENLVDSGSPRGYWTSTANINNASAAYYTELALGGQYLRDSGIALNNSTSIGIRPVITVLESDIN